MAGPTESGDATGEAGTRESAERAAATKKTQKRMRRALRQIRREGLKVAVIYGAVDAALVALVVNLLVQVLKPDFLPLTLPWPVVVSDAILGVVGTRPPRVQTAIVAGVGAGLFVFVVEVVARRRRPIIEQFEHANPEVREALRTARDHLRRGRSSRMGLVLYEDVLTRLRRTSSIGLVNVSRLLITVVVIFVVSVASIQVAVVDLGLGDLSGTNGDDVERPDDEYEGLQDASGVLGDPEDVSAGEETLNTTISTEGGGDDGSFTAAAYDSSGFSDSSDVEGQEAGFAESEQLEDAELIREYNLRIRSEDDET